jgi:oxygen-dependent protoporphyrinogen oxidase
MQSFPQAIAKNLKGNVFYDCKIENIKQNNAKIIVEIEANKQKGEITSDVLLSTIPAYNLAKYADSIDQNLTKHLNDIYYPPVLVLFLGYKKKFIKQKLDGFGFLIPSKENKKFLGAIWSSTIFENRCGDENAAFTLFIGGARNSDFTHSQVNSRTDEALTEFHKIMGISADPIIKEKKFWGKAIPQYNIGYIEHEKYFEQFENENPGIFLSGNYRGGISVGDCIKNSYTNFEKIRNYLN